MILQMAQQGQVQSQITDSYLKQMLEGISEGGVRLIACAALLTHACTRIALSACASYLCADALPRASFTNAGGAREDHIRPPPLWRR